MSRKVDPRINRTRKLFEESLIDLMMEKDYQNITVQEIAKRSTLNRGTFYLHYFDKDDLLEQMLDEALDDLRESMQLIDMEFKYVSDEPHPIFIRLFEKMMERTQFYKIMLADEKIPYFTQSVREMIEGFVYDASDFMKKDQIVYSVPVEIANAYVISAYLGVIIWWLNNDTPYTPIYMATQLTKISTVGPFVDNPYLNNED